MLHVPLAEHHDMIETFRTDRADRALRIAVLPRRTSWCRTIANAEGTNPPNEQIAIASIPSPGAPPAKACVG